MKASSSLAQPSRLSPTSHRHHALPHMSRQRLMLAPAHQVASPVHVAVASTVVAAGRQHIIPPFVPPVIERINDEATHAMASQLRRLPVTLESLGRDPLYTAVAGPTGSELDAMGAGPNNPVMIMLHGFDGNSLGWRYAWPHLQADSRIPVVALDLVGWGLTDHAAWRRDPSLPVSPALKREHLEAFRQQHLGARPLIIAGISLGGTIAADYALAYPDVVKGLVLIDAQGFSEGVTPLPRPLAVLGVQLLKAEWMRVMAHEMAYNKKQEFADGWRVDQLSTYMPGWLETNVAFINSGGVNMSESRIKQITQPVLIVWGTQDEIISPEIGKRWHATLKPGQSKLIWVEGVGHCPPIEKPELVTGHIFNWLEDQGLIPKAAPAAASQTVEQPGQPSEVTVVVMEG